MTDDACEVTIEYCDAAVTVDGVRIGQLPALTRLEWEGNRHGFGEITRQADVTPVILAQAGDYWLYKQLVDHVVGFCFAAPHRDGRVLEAGSTWTTTETPPAGFLEYFYGPFPGSQPSEGTDSITFAQKVTVKKVDANDEPPLATLSWGFEFPANMTVEADVVPMLEELGIDPESYGIPASELKMTMKFAGTNRVDGTTSVRLKDSWPKDASLSYSQSGTIEYVDYPVEVFDPALMVPQEIDLTIETALTLLD